MSHLWAQRVRPSADEFEASSRPTVGALSPNGFSVEYLVLIGFQPHELEALWTATDLR